MKSVQIVSSGIIYLAGGRRQECGSWRTGPSPTRALHGVTPPGTNHINISIQTSSNTNFQHLLDNPNLIFLKICNPPSLSLLMPLQITN